MQVSSSFPPNYQQITDILGDVSKHTPIFCFGGTIYNPFVRDVTPDLVAHEYVHSKQQGNNPEVWWMKYLADAQFRFSQELPAYGAQYAFIKGKMHGKLLDWALDKMASALSGELYGIGISHGEARSKIKNYGK